MLNAALQTAWAEAVAFWNPPPTLPLSEWAEQYAYLSPESAHQPGKWHAFPYQVGIMDAITDPRVETVTIMKSARVGYTKILNHVVGYHIHQDPCPILIVQPTVEDAQGHSKEEIAPMFRDTPCLDGLVADVKAKDSSNTILKKAYPGGVLHLVGANSARGFRRISVRIVLFDEVDGYPPTAGQEGDQITLGTNRTEFYWNRKIIIGSTPTIKGISRVDASFKESDQRYYKVPCPFCGGKQKLEFGSLKWPKGEPQKARFECIFCKKLIPHSKKRWMVERGEWIAEKEFNGHAGFFIWAAYSYSPNATWGKIAEKFLKAKKNREKLKTFKNTVLAQLWEEEGTKVEWVALKNRAEPYEVRTVPTGGLLLVSGVDTHDDRLEASVWAFGRGEESWLIYHTQLFGDPAADAVWEQLDMLLEYPYPHASGAVLRIASMAVDTGGHRTHYVYNYCRHRAPIVMAIKGATQKNRPILGRPTLQDVDYAGQVIKEGVQLWPVGTDTAKSTIYSRLSKKAPEPGADPVPGYVHFPIGMPDEYYQQLTAEQLVTRYVKGFPVLEWMMPEGSRNEALDCYVYAYAAAYRIGLPVMDWDMLERDLAGDPYDDQPSSPASKPKSKKKRRW